MNINVIWVRCEVWGQRLTNWENTHTKVDNFFNIISVTLSPLTMAVYVYLSQHLKPRKPGGRNSKSPHKKAKCQTLKCQNTIKYHETLTLLCWSLSIFRKKRASWYYRITGLTIHHRCCSAGLLFRTNNTVDCT